MHIMTPRPRVFLTLVLALSGMGVTRAVPSDDIDLPFSRYVLPNGLTLVVYEDHSAPLVAINVSYRAGSRDDVPGRTGTAHLLEHLMFNGSEHSSGDYFGTLESAGATDLSGLTDVDRTRYFETVPTSSLELALWMESDRMAGLIAALDSAKLDEQLSVVHNEKRETAEQSYGRAWETIFAHAYPPAHPYSWPITGLAKDLDAITVEDVTAWHAAHYGARNAVLTIAGNVDPEAVRAQVEAYFGHIPPGVPLERVDAWTGQRADARRVRMEDRVPAPRLYKVWNVPGWGSDEAVGLDLVSNVLAGGPNARLSERLIRRDGLATEVEAVILEQELGSLFVVHATPVQGVSLGELEDALDRELQTLVEDGPGADEVERARIRFRSDFYRALERIGGPGGVADVLATNELFGTGPDHYKARMAQVAAATPKSLRQVALEWLNRGALVLEVHPFEEGTVLASDVDRSAPPTPGDPPAPAFPELQKATLSNGLEVVLAERPDVPLVDVRAVVNAGYASDALSQPGTASLAMAMLIEGTTSRSGAEIADRLDALGATLLTGSNLDVSVATVSALRQNLDPSLELFADVVLRPAFAEGDVDRLREAQLAQVRDEMVNPVWSALRVLPGLLYGEDHVYGGSLSGAGTEASIQGISGESLEAFHATWFRPNNTTLVVVGATTLSEIVPKLEDAFGAWESAPIPERPLGGAAPSVDPGVFVLHRPGAAQSAIVGAQLVPPTDNPDELAIETMNGVLGDFAGRINMNLREDKGWSYGVQSLVWGARGARPFVVVAPVQANRTAASLAEINGELQGVVGDRPVTEAEVQRVVAGRRFAMPGTWETNRQLMNAITDQVEYGWSAEHFHTLSDRLARVTSTDVDRVARTVLDPARMVWVVVGDLEVVGPQLEEAGLGPVFQIDGLGQVDGAHASHRSEP